MIEGLPLFNHPLKEPTSFSPETLMDSVRAERNLARRPIPRVCVLEFDGDLTDWLVSTGRARRVNSWACFHTTMFSFEVDGSKFGIVPRTIGGPYSVLVAEQMAAAGARLALGLTSAGGVSSKMPVPGLVAVTSAIRDEGTSLHYLPPSKMVKGPSDVVRALELELRNLSLPVRSGPVWTTDAPYRETQKQIAAYARAGVLAVEMQAASLFAFSSAREFPVGVVAHVTNSIGQTDDRFHKGGRQLEYQVLKAMCRAGTRLVSRSRSVNGRFSRVP